MISGYILGRALGISNQIGELQGRCMCFSVPPLPFSLFLSPFLSFACVPLVESCWRRTSLILLHHVCVLLVSLLSETSDLHVDLRASALWENMCGLYVYGEKGGGRNGWEQSEWGGKLESWNAEQGDTLAWEGRISEVPCCPSSCCPSICECLGMRPSCMLVNDHHTSCIQVWVDVHLQASGCCWERVKKERVPQVYFIAVLSLCQDLLSQVVGKHAL